MRLVGLPCVYTILLLDRPTPTIYSSDDQTFIVSNALLSALEALLPFNIRSFTVVDTSQINWYLCKSYLRTDARRHCFLGKRQRLSSSQPSKQEVASLGRHIESALSTAIR